MSVISTEDLTKRFGGRRGSQGTLAVDRLSLEVEEGRAFAFLGPNGAGKTTTIYMLLGLRRPTSGRGLVFGKPLGSVGARARIGFLPEAMNAKAYYTTEGMLRYCTRLHKMSDRAARERIGYVLAAMGLEEMRHEQISRLSKGTVQRLGLAQALVSDPDLLILDEPTSNLDPVGRRDVMRLLGELKRQGKTIFISSHVLSEVESVCDDIGIINRGRLVRRGPLGDLASQVGGYQVTTRGLGEQACEEIRRAGGLVEAKPDGTIEISARDEQMQQRVVAITVREGCPVLSATRRSGTLEEVFFRTLEEGETR
jgi:ABC-2 type transport system ATP-binding protein